MKRHGIDNSGRFKKGLVPWNKGKKMPAEVVERVRQKRLANPIRYWLGKVRRDTAGSNHWKWNGGRCLYSNGYIYLARIFIEPEYLHHFKPGRAVAEHRYVWLKTHGGEIPKGYFVHHINEDKTDNRPENLELLNGKEHSALHLKGKISTSMRTRRNNPNGKFKLEWRNGKWRYPLKRQKLDADGKLASN